MKKVIEIYSKENCVYCTKAKALLKEHDPMVLMLDRDFNREEFFKIFPDAKSFPQIIISGKHIGGYNEAEKYLLDNSIN
jgi:glutaredoxin|tara:strand:- start:295 stop:531 length:237 start_codon:yes stop_codon:yes gene_type:complete